jgi:hypothetical protein
MELFVAGSGSQRQEFQVVGRLKRANCAGYRYGYAMDQNISEENSVGELEELREAIAMVQVLELNDHSAAYEQIHVKLEEALRSIDGK